jgi:ribosomal protein L40E
MTTFDLTPDPKVLIALTHTPMQPLDALCELIDNAIDSFHVAELQGNPIKSPLIAVDLPKPASIQKEEGSLVVRDNGSGLTLEMAEKALRAGFSGNNPYDSLGLFGMGFNISTGKLGRETRFLTARKSDKEAIEVTVDLDKINKAKSYNVPVQTVAKPEGFIQGTLVEVRNWWPEGNPNNGFIRKLIQYGQRKVREEIGRRYSTILRERKIQIYINNETVFPYEHCVWGDNRNVTRRGIGSVPAVMRFDEVVGTQKRCTACNASVEASSSNCQTCGSLSLRTIEERIRGWVGIQRFDDPTEFGIDIIRNGRAVRIGEKTAFFEFTDEFKKVIKDYPIDSPYGRIVGEVHLNHVPVDFLKQDFQRSSPEWQRAMLFLRGDSSLQPSQSGADKNASPIFKLYQGYRRVRNVGKADMYMGYWDDAEGAAKRISRDVEQDYLKKFRDRLAGFYDDIEWWKLVEKADRKPLEELIECPNCGAQNLKGHDVCQACDHILKGKTCIVPECGLEIPLTAASCPHCGVSQIPSVEKEWRCEVCLTNNPPAASTCKKCGNDQGSLHPLSREHLLKNADRSDSLSFPGCSIQLADDTYSPSIDVATYIVSLPILPPGKTAGLPLIAIKTPERIEVFVDLGHVAFKYFGIKPEYFVAQEVALYIFDSNRRLSQFTGIHTLTNITWQVVQAKWADVLNDSPQNIKQDIIAFLENFRQELPTLLNKESEDIFDSLLTSDQKLLAENMLGQGKDLNKLTEMKKNGEFLKFVDYGLIPDLFKKYTECFFDDKYWSISFLDKSGLAADVVEQIRKRTHLMYLNCIEDAVAFIDWQSPEPSICARARAALTFLKQKLA